MYIYCIIYYLYPITNIIYTPFSLCHCRLTFLWVLLDILALDPGHIIFQTKHIIRCTSQACILNVLFFYRTLYNHDIVLILVRSVMFCTKIHSALVK